MCQDHQQRGPYVPSSNVKGKVAALAKAMAKGVKSHPDEPRGQNIQFQSSLKM